MDKKYKMNTCDQRRNMLWTKNTTLTFLFILFIIKNNITFTRLIKPCRVEAQP